MPQFDDPIDDDDRYEIDDADDEDPTLDRTPERSIIAYDDTGTLVRIDAMPIDGLDQKPAAADESDAN